MKVPYFEINTTQKLQPIETSMLTLCITAIQSSCIHIIMKATLALELQPFYLFTLQPIIMMEASYSYRAKLSPIQNKCKLKKRMQ